MEIVNAATRKREKNYRWSFWNAIVKNCIVVFQAIPCCHNQLIFRTVHMCLCRCVCSECRHIFKVTINIHFFMLLRVPASLTLTQYFYAYFFHCDLYFICCFCWIPCCCCCICLKIQATFTPARSHMQRTHTLRATIISTQIDVIAFQTRFDINIYSFIFIFSATMLLFLPQLLSLLLLLLLLHSDRKNAVQKLHVCIQFSTE